MADNTPTGLVTNVDGQTMLFVPCEVCRTTVAFGSLVYSVGRDKWACPGCWSVWYQ